MLLTVFAKFVSNLPGLRRRVELGFNVYVVIAVKASLRSLVFVANSSLRFFDVTTLGLPTDFCINWYSLKGCLFIGLFKSGVK